MNTDLQTKEITALYKVAFNRAPDAEGLAYWLNDMAHGQTLDQVAHSFSPYIPQFSLHTAASVIDQFSINAFAHIASNDVQNHWQILGLNAVPSYALVEEMALQICGQQLDAWASPVL